MLRRRHGLLALPFLVACPPPDTKDLLYEPVPLEAHDVKIEADAVGDAKTPAHVSVFLQRGILQVKGGGGHTIEGVATGAQGDAPPRVEILRDRIALAQSAIGGSPPGGDAKFMLAFGDTPMTLEVDTGSGEAQTIDLGGVPVTKGRFRTATGHLTIDWSSQNPASGGTFGFDTDAGYIDVAHLGRSGASRVDVANVAGLVSLDLGDLPLPAPAIAIGATVTSGTFVLKIPQKVAALANITAPEGSITAKGWRPGAAAGSFAMGPPDATPRVTLHVSAKGGHVELRTE
jgi:hypothetical protein